MKLIKKLVLIVSVLTGILSILGLIVEKINTLRPRDEGEKNPFENKRVRFVEDESDPENADGVRGHLEIIDSSAITPSEEHRVGFYERVVKRGLDVILSSAGLVILSPVLAVISVAVVIDDPGPILFTQKRIGKDKSWFSLHKFRSMRMSTPKDTPTHMLADPGSYITRVGSVLRRTSADELPQLFDIWTGRMSVIGPRPALWNQDKLVALRDHISTAEGVEGVKGVEGKESRRGVDANSVRPGLTGLAQIKGRDELELEVKSSYDRQYAEVLRAGGWNAFRLDCKCFFGTVVSVLKHDGVVEGGTGTINTSDTEER